MGNFWDADNSYSLENQDPAANTLSSLYDQSDACVEPQAESPQAPPSVKLGELFTDPTLSRTIEPEPDPFGLIQTTDPMEILHTSLDLAGLTPALGAIPDAINTGLYAIEGDWTNFGLSAAATLPGLGQAATVGKIGARAGSNVAGEGIETGVGVVPKTAGKPDPKPKPDVSEAIPEQEIPKYDTPSRPLSSNQRAALKEKLDNRTITREEYQRLEWDRRFSNRRNRGVSRYWAQERRKLRAGEPGTRNWSPEQRDAILKGKRPKFDGDTLEGHHKYNALDHPQIADDPNNIYPATKKEHLERWHGGNFQNDTTGNPLTPSSLEEF